MKMLFLVTLLFGASACTASVPLPSLLPAARDLSESLSRMDPALMIFRDQPDSDTAKALADFKKRLEEMRTTCKVERLKIQGKRDTADNLTIAGIAVGGTATIGSAVGALVSDTDAKTGVAIGVAIISGTATIIAAIAKVNVPSDKDMQNYEASSTRYADELDSQMGLVALDADRAYQERAAAIADTLKRREALVTATQNGATQPVLDLLKESLKDAESREQKANESYEKANKKLKDLLADATARLTTAAKNCE